MFLTSIITFLFPMIVKVTSNIFNLIILVPGIQAYTRSTMVALSISMVAPRIALEAIIFSGCVIVNYYIGSYDMWKSP